jgi:ABC-2 type transport system ATP-binding protein
MLEIKNISKSFDGFDAVKNASISVSEGTIHGIIGENGAGKTTIIKCAAGIYKPDSGEITVDGMPVYDNPQAKSLIGYVADSNSYFGMYTIKQMIKFYKGVYKSFDEKRFNELNEIFSLDVKKRINQLSKGMQMRLALMLNMSIHPKVLILDEPTSGLDAIAKNAFNDMLISLVDEEKTAVLISSHHLSELERLCDSISLIKNGDIYYQSNLDEIKSSVRKLQVVLRYKTEFKDIDGIMSVERVGSIYYLIVKNYGDEMKKQLEAMGAEIVEEVGMSLEEIFIYSTKAQDGL